MPSVQWGATGTAQLVFTPISAPLGDLSNAAGTIAILWKPVGTDCDGGGLTNYAITAWYHTVSMRSSKWGDDDMSAVYVQNTTSVTGSHWYITVVGWPAGSAQTERFHWIDLTAGGAWHHENAAVTNGTPATGPGTSGSFIAGSVFDNVIASGTQIALIAAWNVQLGDADAQALSGSRKTSDWYLNPAGTPVFLSEITSLTPTDLISSCFSPADSVTTNLTVGGAPDGGWTFDQTGVVAMGVPALVQALPFR